MKHLLYRQASCLYTVGEEGLLPRQAVGHSAGRREDHRPAEGAAGLPGEVSTARAQTLATTPASEPHRSDRLVSGRPLWQQLSHC